MILQTELGRLTSIQTELGTQTELVGITISDWLIPEFFDSDTT